MPVLIKKLNQSLRGWANYHRHVVASEAFSRIDSYVFRQLRRMLRRRHQNTSKDWLIKKYWSAKRPHAFLVWISCLPIAGSVNIEGLRTEPYFAHPAYSLVPIYPDNMGSFLVR